MARKDTFFVGTIKGVEKIYQQMVIGANSSHVSANLHLSRVSMTAADALNEQVLLFQEEHGIEIERLLTATAENTAAVR